MSSESVKFVAPTTTPESTEAAEELEPDVSLPANLAAQMVQVRQLLNLSNSTRNMGGQLPEINVESLVSHQDSSVTPSHPHRPQIQLSRSMNDRDIALSLNGSKMRVLGPQSMTASANVSVDRDRLDPTVTAGNRGPSVTVRLSDIARSHRRASQSSSGLDPDKYERVVSRYLDRYLSKRQQSRDSSRTLTPSAQRHQYGCKVYVTDTQGTVTMLDEQDLKQTEGNRQTEPRQSKRVSFDLEPLPNEDKQLPRNTQHGLASGTASRKGVSHSGSQRRLEELDSIKLISKPSGFRLNIGRRLEGQPTDLQSSLDHSDQRFILDSSDLNMEATTPDGISSLSKATVGSSYEAEVLGRLSYPQSSAMLVF